jgi:hypothetical protein
VGGGDSFNSHVDIQMNLVRLRSNAVLVRNTICIRGNVPIFQILEF